MCGKQFHMIEQLLGVIQARSPTLKKLSPITPQTYAFMFAKKECPYSQGARLYMIENLKIVPDNICILDVEKEQLICATKWKWLENNEDTKKNRSDLFNLWRNNYSNDTVPQIFLHFPHQWHYVNGGCDGLQHVSTDVDILGSDLLHLLPLARVGTRTPSIQLKF